MDYTILGAVDGSGATWCKWCAALSEERAIEMAVGGVMREHKLRAAQVGVGFVLRGRILPCLMDQRVGFSGLVCGCDADAIFPGGAALLTLGVHDRSGECWQMMTRCGVSASVAAAVAAQMMRGKKGWALCDIGVIAVIADYTGPATGPERLMFDGEMPGCDLRGSWAEAV